MRLEQLRASSASCATATSLMLWARPCMQRAGDIALRTRYATGVHKAVVLFFNYSQLTQLNFSPFHGRFSKWTWFSWFY